MAKIKLTPSQITKKKQEYFNGTTDAIKYLEIVGILYKKAKTDEARREVADKALQAEMIIRNNNARF